MIIHCSFFSPNTKYERNGLLNFQTLFSRVIGLDYKNARDFILYYVPCVKYLEEEHSI